MNNLPKHIQLKIKSFTPKYKDLTFTTTEDFIKWRDSVCECQIILKDVGQDLMSFYLAESGEILHTEIPSLGKIYNGALLLDTIELILPGDIISVWIPMFNEVTAFKYEVEKVIRK